MNLKKRLKIIFKILLMLWIFFSGVLVGNAYQYQDATDSIFRILTALIALAICIYFSIKD